MRFSIHVLSPNGSPAAFHVFAHSSQGRIVIVSPPGGLSDRTSVAELLVRNGACPDAARLRIDEAARRHIAYLELERVVGGNG
jgi:hypothetical protein